jgi:Fe2+ transport system protein FeoA
MPLNSLRPGERARVEAIKGHPDHVLRLEEFGLRGGITVEMFRRGNPCILRLAGHKICLRADQMLQIHVVLEEMA